MLGRRVRAGKSDTRSSRQFNNLRFVTTSQLGMDEYFPRMTRPLRLAYPSALYHVTSGNG